MKNEIKIKKEAKLNNSNPLRDDDCCLWVEIETELDWVLVLVLEEEDVIELDDEVGIWKVKTNCLKIK